MGENFKGFIKRSANSEVLMMLFLKVARKAIIGGFEKIKFDIHCADPKAYDWIKNIPPKYWADAYCSRSRYSHLTSNMAESFNAWILSAREKPIITMYEEIRVQLMTRFEEKSELVEYFRRAFETPFAPVPDDIELTNIYNQTVLPPRTTRLLGRPKTQRRIYRTKHSITRHFKCKQCGAERHNKGTCKEPIE
ncbi:hypothetical protein AMTR_s00007p00156040 [Amborella trichopoda]|uniref:Uncharacterized protein n=1 Tax=Amborella trichopoda TaxID=13333 RepID=W1PE23_AMBTC|nr:hypothetical protein AMTR_s00007p00156040 [Amborella trichopoda]